MLVPPAPLAMATASELTSFKYPDSDLATVTLVFTVTLAPLSVSTWTGGSDVHQAMLAEAEPAPPITSAPDARMPAIKVRAFIATCPLLRAESVSESTHRVNQPRTAVLLELLPDPRDVHLERVGLRTRRDRPHSLRQLGVCDELPAVAHEGGEDPELDARQRQPLALPRRESLAQVDDHIGGRELRAAFAAVAADHRLDARDQLLERERLGHVVVRAQLESRDPIADRRPSADPDQRGVRLGPKRLEQLGAVVVGKHQVEQDHVGIPAPNQVKPPAGRVDGPHRVAFPAEAVDHRTRQPPIVLHESDLPFDA